MHHWAVPLPPYMRELTKRNAENDCSKNNNKLSSNNSSFPFHVTQPLQKIVPNHIREYSLPPITHQTMVSKWIQGNNSVTPRNVTALVTDNEYQGNNYNHYNNNNDDEDNYSGNNNNNCKSQNNNNNNNISVEQDDNSKIQRSDTVLMPFTQPTTIKNKTLEDNFCSCHNTVATTNNNPLQKTFDKAEKLASCEIDKNNQNNNTSTVLMLKQMLELFTNVSKTFTASNQIVNLNSDSNNTSNNNSISTVTSTTKTKDNKISQEMLLLKNAIVSLESVMSSVLKIEKEQSDVMQKMCSELEAMHKIVTLFSEKLEQRQNYQEEHHDQHQEQESLLTKKKALLGKNNNNFLNVPLANSKKSNKHVHQATQTSKHTHSSENHSHHYDKATHKREVKEHIGKRKTYCVTLNQTQLATQHTSSLKNKTQRHYNHCGSSSSSSSSLLRANRSAGVYFSPTQTKRRKLDSCKMSRAEVKHHTSTSSRIKMPFILGYKCASSFRDCEEESLFMEKLANVNAL